MTLRNQRPLQLRQLRRLRSMTHVHPYHATDFARRIRRLADISSLKLHSCCSLDISTQAPFTSSFQPVIHTAQAVLLVATEKQRSTPSCDRRTCDEAFAKCDKIGRETLRFLPVQCVSRAFIHHEPRAYDSPQESLLILS